MSGIRTFLSWCLVGLLITYIVFIGYDLYCTWDYLQHQPVYLERKLRQELPLQQYHIEDALLISGMFITQQITQIRTVVPLSVPICIVTTLAEKDLQLSVPEKGVCHLFHVPTLLPSVWDLVKLVPARRVVYVSPQVQLLCNPLESWVAGPKAQQSLFFTMPKQQAPLLHPEVQNHTSTELTGQLHFFCLHREQDFAALSALDWVMKLTVDGVLSDLELWQIAWHQVHKTVYTSGLWYDETTEQCGVVVGPDLETEKVPWALLSPILWQEPQASPLAGPWWSGTLDILTYRWCDSWSYNKETWQPTRNAGLETIPVHHLQAIKENSAPDIPV